MDHFSPRPWFEETPNEDLTEAIRYARRRCSKQLQSDAVIIWFNDRYLLTLPHGKIHRMTDCMHYAPAATKEDGAKLFFAQE